LAGPFSGVANTVSAVFFIPLLKNQPHLCKILSMSTEADTCRKYVLPKLLEAGWDNDPHSFTEQRTFTDGRIVVSGDKIRRKKQKRADYLLRYTSSFVPKAAHAAEENEIFNR
jgi:phenylalanyl-tRNA synthetase beta subunit